jgi:ABC-type transport system substrate-binding protein
MLRPLLLALGCLGVVSAASSADMSKTLYTYYEAPETAFDPAKYSDNYSIDTCSVIFETLLTYDYLARPQKLVPGTAGMPEVLDGGRRYIFKLQPGIYFANDPAFKGKKRELTAQDYVYSLQRLVDPANRGAPWEFILKGKVIGLDEKIEEAKKTGKFDYDKPIEGLKALDRYTLQLSLKRPDFLIPMMMAAPATGAVAREVIEFYGEDAEAHPVGTGPYMLESWKRGNHIVLKANPDYRGVTYRLPEGAKPVDAEALRQLEGKTFPRIGRIDIRIIEVPQASWLAFDGKQLDLHPRLGNSYALKIAPNGVLAGKYAQSGIRFYREPEADITYYQFNMDDPIVGGYTPDKVALRRALSFAYNQAQFVALLSQNQALPAQSPLAPGLFGYDPNFRNVLGEYNPAKGNALLDLFGYKDCNGDGYRDLPRKAGEPCKPFTVDYAQSTGGDTRLAEEFMQKMFDKVSIRLNIRKMPFSDLVKLRQSGKYMMAGGAWGQDYPDAENFMQLLYGPNAGPANESRFRHKDFDKLYEEIASMPDSEERNEKLRQMSRIVNAYVPWILNTNRIRTHLAQPWVVGYRPHPSSKPYFQYLDIDTAQRAMQTKR